MSKIVNIHIGDRPLHMTKSWGNVAMVMFGGLDTVGGTNGSDRTPSRHP